MTPAAVALQAGDALLIVDVQNDFLPGGALAVPAGDAVIAPLNRYLAVFAAHGRPVYATRDWHPPDHCSFRQRGGPWPPHCVQHTPGAAFAAGLELPADAIVISKADAPALEAYSGFAGTDLHALLQGAGVGRLFVGGLATDYCVRETVLDALRIGYGVILLRDAIRAVELRAGDGDAAVSGMIAGGAVPLTLQDLGR